MITKEQCRATEYARIDNCIDKDYAEYEKALSDQESWKTKLEATYISKDSLLINRTRYEHSSSHKAACSRINLLTLKIDLMKNDLTIFLESNKVLEQLAVDALKKRDIAEEKDKAANAKEAKRLKRNARQRERRAVKRAEALAEA